MLALGLGLIAALGWGTHDLLVRTIAPGARVLPQLAAVMLVAALVTAPFGWTRALPDPETLALAIASGCTYFGASLALYAAFARAPVKLVAPVIGAYPLPALGYELLRGNPVSGIEWLAAGLIVAGVAVVATQGDSDSQRPHPAALPLAFAACFGMATSFALGQEAASRIEPMHAASLARSGGGCARLGAIGTATKGRKGRAETLAGFAGDGMFGRAGAFVCNRCRRLGAGQLCLGDLILVRGGDDLAGLGHFGRAGQASTGGGDCADFHRAWLVGLGVIFLGKIVEKGAIFLRKIISQAAKPPTIPATPPKLCAHSAG